MPHAPVWKPASIPLAAWLALGIMSFGQDTVKLMRPRKISQSVAALPRIANPSPAQAKINRAFASFDASARQGAAACDGPSEEGDEMSYERSVTVTSQGPLFLSVFVADSIDCGGVHPSYEPFTLTYNLHTGETVHWAKLLTKVRAEEVRVNPGNVLPTSLSGVTSLLLQKLYRDGWKDQGAVCQIDDIVDPTGETLTAFLLSPAPHGAGLSVLPTDLASVETPCEVPVVLGKSGMTELGISEEMQKALLAHP